MSGLETTYQRLLKLDGGQRSSAGSSPAAIIVTLVYLVCVLSVPLYQPHRLVWLAAYPVVAAEINGIGYGRIFVKSLWILPLAVMIGIFNPFIDTAPAFFIGSTPVSRGWLSFSSIIIRGLLSFQAVLILVASTGFIDIINSLRKIGCPAVLTTQLLLTYRYISVIISEAMLMRQAREARGYGRKSYPLKMWGRFIGQLLIRSSRRATWIHRAMSARGFDGSVPTGSALGWSRRSVIWLCVWCVAIVCLRVIDFSPLIGNVLSRC